MSFFTSLVYYRPCPPPVVTGKELMRFVDEVHRSGVLAEEGLSTLQVKFGRSIDQDQHGTLWQEEIAPRMFVTHQIEWDISLKAPADMRAALDALAKDSRRIYRAYLAFKKVRNEVLSPVTRTNSPENSRDYCPSGLSFEVGPVKIYDLRSDAPTLAGWMHASLSGYGYLYPWTFREVLQRLESTPEIQRIASVCRSCWPVPPEVPKPQIVAVRKQLGEVWPYENFDKPWDWYWGIQESG
jgi:hypothetical protein